MITSTPHGHQTQRRAPLRVRRRLPLGRPPERSPAGFVCTRQPGNPGSGVGRSPPRARFPDQPIASVAANRVAQPPLCLVVPRHMLPSRSVVDGTGGATVLRRRAWRPQREIRTATGNGQEQENRGSGLGAVLICDWSPHDRFLGGPVLSGAFVFRRPGGTARPKSDAAGELRRSRCLQASSSSLLCS